MQEPIESIEDFEWLNKELFVKIFQQESIEYDDITSFTVGPASKAGENYSSEIMIATVYAKSCDNTEDHINPLFKKSFILKAKSKAIVRSRDVFKKEINMYSVIIPLLEKSLENINQKMKFAPQ